MPSNHDLYHYTLRLADNGLVLGQRLAEWCGHGPILEQDIALTNIALDLIGQARNYYQYAATLTEEHKDEDALAYCRNERQYSNILLVEQPNSDFAHTVIRQYFFDVFHQELLAQLATSREASLAAIAQKSAKEVAYHKRWSSQWVLRLGDGTEESHAKAQLAVHQLWDYAFESVTPDELDLRMRQEKVGADLGLLSPLVQSEIKSHLTEATLTIPQPAPQQLGGKKGLHTEHLGYLLAEMQHLHRSLPGVQW